MKKAWPPAKHQKVSKSPLKCRCPPGLCPLSTTEPWMKRAICYKYWLRTIMSTNPKPPDITKDVPIHRLCPFNRPNQRRKRKRQRRNKWFQSHGREKRSSWQTTWSSVAVCVVPSRCRCHVCIVYVCHVSRIHVMYVSRAQYIHHSMWLFLGL